MKKIGKIGRMNIRANQKLKAIYQEKGIDRCEVRLPGCMEVFALSFAHWHKRIWYKEQKNGSELLASYQETVLACPHCHARMESDKELTEEIFNRLRST